MSTWLQLVGILVGVATASVPATTWHNNAGVQLPPGARQIVGEPCRAIFETNYLGHVEPQICYEWSDSRDVYQLLALQFDVGGYRRVREIHFNAQTTIAIVQRPGTAVVDVAIFMYNHDGGLTTLAYNQLHE